MDYLNLPAEPNHCGNVGGAARALDVATLLHGPMRDNCLNEAEVLWVKLSLGLKRGGGGTTVTMTKTALN